MWKDLGRVKVYKMEQGGGKQEITETLTSTTLTVQAMITSD